MSDQQLLTVKEAASYLGVSESTVWKLLREGDLQSVKVLPTTTRITREALQTFIKERYDESNASSNTLPTDSLPETHT